MASLSSALINWAEQGWVSDQVARAGIRRLIRSRLAEVQRGATDEADRTQHFVERMRTAALALLPERANEQHYELPPEFFATVLGPHRKYSSAYWPQGTTTLSNAEQAALAQTCERAQLADGQNVLELGCGWGSLTLWMAAAYPRSTVTALSNSCSQRRFLEAEAGRRGLDNVRVITCDINEFDTAERFDRVVSVEMFEHLRNWPRAFAQVARWLDPGGKFFLHVFAHRSVPYAFVERDASDWMSQHFFSGGMMPSDDLALHCQDDLRLVQRWRWDGTHYQRTAEEWLSRMDANRAELQPLFCAIYGSAAAVWWMRWRLFFMAVAELFGFDRGQQWWVSHYLFEKRE
ncbi:cyclopropane-fatty-acyl-phospholipid synthase family protein [Variovorax sp. Sphag1AA]|uniref:SAM-dependent methyltransferase n=1 Tax=Variovorax sp. Sphag1AA TaxID=2587027 RepID=UPI00161B73F6|nr:cyclopropane-fatty-acyl-phospholipid synthase family protein [Variovorax sp. Sphag1AA]MBB3181552.1 cyclopropane-fatty-acyl-phospholipid synthase [Variovorax sp. Sphag1AA]